MGGWVAIDPGTNVAGVAVFAARGVLERIVEVKAPGKWPRWARIEAIADEVAEIVDVAGRRWAVIEEPENRIPGRGRFAVVALAEIVGAIVARLRRVRVEIAIVGANEWTGRVPKASRSAVVAAMIGIPEAVATSSPDAVDAACLGVWWGGLEPEARAAIVGRGAVRGMASSSVAWRLRGRRVAGGV